jgi:hypothetical protein
LEAAVEWWARISARHDLSVWPRLTGVVHDPPEGLVHGVGVDRFTAAISEHPSLIVADADVGELGGSEGLPPSDYRQRRVVEGDRAAGGLGLAPGLVDLVAHGLSPTAASSLAASATRPRSNAQASGESGEDVRSG